ncbi:MAG: oligosaccharide flippase family protein [Acetobacteraceae bacterium]|nr:oligosaccharide flippase family protein [Acetobacteraceae bacterium]
MSLRLLAGRASPRLALMLSFAQRHSVLLIRLAALMILARLLTPDQHGVFATAVAISNLATIASEVGVQQFLIRTPALSLPVQRSALGTSLSVACAIAAAVLGLCALAPAQWLSQDFRWTLGLLALSLPVLPFNSVAIAVLQRELRFGPLYAVGVAGTAASAVTAITLAACGAGPLSMACGAIAEAMASFALLRLFAPLVRPSLDGWRSVFRFGWVWATVNVLSEIGHSVTHVIVGSLMGFGAVGVLARAQNVAWLFHRTLLDAIYPVVLPIVAERLRGGQEIGPLYSRQAAYLAVVAWPFFGAVALLAEPLVRLLLGPGWDAAVPAVRILSAEGLFLPLAGLIMPYLVALGLLDRFLPMQIGLQGGRLVLVAATSLVSLEAVCVVLVAEVAVRLVFVQMILRSAFRLHGTALLDLLARSAVPALACLAGAAASQQWLATPDTPAWLALAMALAMGGPPWLLALVAVRHPLREEAGKLLQLVSRRRGAATASPDAAGGDANVRAAGPVGRR